ncbi:MAG: hypothetical protein Q8M55_08600, partial [Actinomycetota bacterium]|nr:hypothetical protein [Actinomycetota bacterium]
TTVPRDGTRLWIEYPHRFQPGLWVLIMVLLSPFVVLAATSLRHGAPNPGAAWLLIGFALGAVAIRLGTGRTERIDIDSKMITVERGAATDQAQLRRNTDAAWLMPPEDRRRWQECIAAVPHICWGREDRHLGRVLVGSAGAGLPDWAARRIVEIMNEYLTSHPADLEFEPVDPLLRSRKAARVVAR